MEGLPEENMIRSLCIVPVPEFRVDCGTHVASYDRAMKISFFQSANYDSEIFVAKQAWCDPVDSRIEFGRQPNDAIYLPCPRVHAHYIKLRFVKLRSCCILHFSYRLVGGILSVRTPFNG